MSATLKNSHVIKCSVEHSTCNFAPCPFIQYCRPHSVLITESANLAALYNLQTREWTKSWSFTSLSPLSCPMVYDEKEERYVAVRNKRTLRLFKIDEEMEQGVSIKLPEMLSITCLLSTKRGVYALAQSGQIYCLDALLKAENQSPISVGTWPVKESLKCIHVVPSNRHVQPRVCFELQNEAIIVNLDTPDADHLRIRLPAKVKDVSAYLEHVIITTEDLQMIKLDKNGLQEPLFHLSSLGQPSDKIIQVKHASLSKTASIIITICKNERGHLMSLYDAKSHSQLLQLPLESEPMLGYGCVSLVENHVFVKCNNSLLSVMLASRQLSLLDTIQAAVQEQRQENAKLPTPTELITQLQSTVKPKELERLLTIGLNYLLQFEQEDASDEQKPLRGKRKRSDHALSKSQEKSLLPLVCATPFTSEFLIEQVKAQQYTREQLSTIMRFLCDHLIACETQDTIITCIEWISVMLDAYFISLNTHLAKDFKEIVHSTRNVLCKLITSYSGCAELRSLLQTVLCLFPDTNGQSKPLINLPNGRHLGYKQHTFSI